MTAPASHNPTLSTVQLSKDREEEQQTPQEVGVIDPGTVSTRALIQLLAGGPLPGHRSGNRDPMAAASRPASAVESRRGLTENGRRPAPANPAQGTRHR
jgi:hypothetical protein